MQLERIRSDLDQRIRKIFQELFQYEGSIPIEFEYPDPQFGDLAIPCFSFAKILKKSPQDIAHQLQSQVSQIDYIQEVIVIGGYLNMFIKLSSFTWHVENNPIMSPEKKKIVLEFASPNTNKPLHLGHMRNIALGEALTAILRSQGHHIIKTEIFNDRGIAIAKMMLMYDMFHQDEVPTIKTDHYVGKLYIEFEERAATLPELVQQAQDILTKWESGDTYWYDLWLKLRDWAINGQKETYYKIGTSFDEDMYESDIYQEGKDIVLDGLNRGIFKKHPEEEYIYADLEEFGLPNKILLRPQGTALYITQDIALLYYRLFGESLCKGADKLIYITAFEQNLQFKQLFAIAQQLGIPQETLYHLGYGMFRLPSGKMSSRKGTVINADDLIQEIENTIGELYFKDSVLSQEEQDTRIHSIARASYMYYILSTSATKDMIFDINSSIQLSGKTGPYILYTYARIKSLLRKYNQEPIWDKDAVFDEFERRIIMKIAKFNEVRDHSAREYDPSYIAHYIFELAELLNSYYHSTPILKESNEHIKNNRVYLLKRAADILQQGLSLLTIETLEEM